VKREAEEDWEMSITLMRAITAAFIFTAIAPAFAASVRIDSTIINLPVPKDFCELASNDSSEKKMLTTVGKLLKDSGYNLLSMSADCRQLAAWDAGQRKVIDDIVEYTTPTAPQIVSESTIHQECEKLRSQGGQNSGEFFQNTKEAWAGASLNLTSERFAGVLAEEPNACYAALLQKIKLSGGSDKTQFVEWAMTVIKGKLIQINLLGVYSAADTPDRLQRNLKEIVTALHAAN
jgi:uncharacterized lipoprotein